MTLSIEGAERATSRARAPIDWGAVIGVGGYHVLALLAFVPYFFSWTGVILTVVGTQLFCTVGINVFYHRYLTHKGFQTHKWFEYVLAVLAVCTLQDTPARWVAVHRRHHEHADDEPDPHTPIRSFLWAHIGWILVKSPEISRYEIYARYAKDVLRDPFYRALELKRVYYGIIAAHALIFFAGGWLAVTLGGGSQGEAVQFGLSLLVWGVFLRTVLNWHNTWSVNSVTHLWGYRNYETDENSRNNLFVGIATMGEGWHNNHHADPRSARHGHRWWEFDGSYWIIRFFGLLGLAWKITQPQVRAHGEAVKTHVDAA